ncbi:MAG: L,D-transpeptidase family protein [Alphaproteobacteria bacterium]|nr:L,D-transpeptidase family protein [Alphaproteobacteria bacterium]
MARFIRLCLILLALVTTIALPARAQDDEDKSFYAIQSFYAMREYKSIWTDGDGFTPKGRRLPAILAGAAAHGIDPETYGVSRIASMLDGKGLPETPEGWHAVELEMTYYLWQFASDLMGQPIDAETLFSVADGDIEDNLQALAPSQPLYGALKTRLAELDTQIANENLAGVTESPALSFGKKLFKPGMSHPDVQKLRTLMVPFGAMALSETESPEVANRYDESLAKSVSRFQQEYGLKDDGTIGPETLRILNRDPRTLRVQVVANMQRLREPHRRLREDSRIEVSIARFWLTGYEDGREAISMPVIVGKPTRQTISFRTEITGVRLNPMWYVPPTIKKEDFIPMLVKDPARLVKMHGVNVVHNGKQVSNPAEVEWAKMSPKELSQVAFWRPAGDGNPLGRYRVIMDNPYDIYLHDTNHPDLFDDSMRAQSSGCVRVSRPEDLANFLLQHKTGWSPQKTKDTVKTGRTFDVVMESKMPIYLDYMTAWFNSRNQVILGVDVYKLDTPRYDGLVKHVLTTQRNAQKISQRVTDILTPELQEAHHREPVLTHSTN